MDNDLSLDVLCHRVCHRLTNPMDVLEQGLYGEGWLACHRGRFQAMGGRG